MIEFKFKLNYLNSLQVYSFKRKAFYEVKAHVKGVGIDKLKYKSETEREKKFYIKRSKN